MYFFLAFKIILFTLLVPGTVTVYIPYLLISGFNSKLQEVNLVLILLASVMIFIGILIYLRCAFDFAVDGLGTPAPIDPPKKLVITGLYRWNRNPMYQGILFILLAENLLFFDRSLLLYASTVALIFHVLVVLYEEPILAKKFDVFYHDYCRKVPRWGFALKAYPIDPA